MIPLLIFVKIALFSLQGFDTVERLNESGELREMLKPYQVIRESIPSFDTCDETDWNHQFPSISRLIRLIQNQSYPKSSSFSKRNLKFVLMKIKLTFHPQKYL